MIFNNPNFITFSGEPITGRTPTKTLVLGDWPMTQAQQGGVAHAYKLFCDTVRLSPAGYHVQNRVLQDGTTVRMISNNGIDTVEVRPVGGGGSIITCIFRGVPSSNTNKNGVLELGPSAKWTYHFVGGMPKALTPVGPLVDHPGHITWTGKGFRLGGQEVVLSWRGPDDRYSASTGWSLATGGDIVGHELGLIGDRTYLYKDTSFVWFHGRPVNTGIIKVIAAALHRPDPTDKSKVVLRVCSDNYPQDSTTRGFVVFDLVPTGAAEPGPLAGIVNATGFDILNTYPATQFSTATNLPVTGTWVTRQRPHFNNLGDELATSINWRDVGANPMRLVAVCFDPTTWSMLSTYGPTGTSTHAKTATTSFTWVPTASPPLAESATVDFVESWTFQNKVLLAADFKDAAFVYMTLSVSTTRTLTVSSYASRGAADTESRTEVNTALIQAEHSVHGLLATRNYSSTKLQAVSTYAAQHTLSQSGAEYFWQPRFAHMVGDLSRDLFAIGLPVAQSLSISYDGPAAGDSTLLYATGVPISSNRQTLSYDVFSGSSAVVTNTVGSYAAAANPQLGSTTSISAPRQSAIIALESETPLASFSTADAVDFLDAAGWSYAVLPLSKHTATVDGGRAAYFGVAWPYDLGGLEITLVKDPKNKRYRVLTVPPYAPGALPTICAPVFLSVTEIRK
jgi:hypothetical protein